MPLKKILGLVLAAVIALSTAAMPGAVAASREEIDAIRVSRAGNFKYWTKDSAARQRLVDYVRDVTDRKSPDFIPVEERVAVFDVDGTLLCETAPAYFEYMMFLHRALEDPAYTATPEVWKHATELRAALDSRGKVSASHTIMAAPFAGMTLEEFDAYTERCMEMDVEGLANLKYGEGFYLPMVEVVRYLAANDFGVYLVSGSDRYLLRPLCRGVLSVPPERIIGATIAVEAAGQHGASNRAYLYAKEDRIVRGVDFVGNVGAAKPATIAREIGRRPVLAFGNSAGDASMLNYTLGNTRRKSLAFVLLCDDTARELGIPAKAEAMRKLATEHGWIPVSMRDDFATIYGDNVMPVK